MSQTVEYMTVEEVAALLRVGEKTVRRLIKTGELPAVRIGRQFRVAKNDLPGGARA